MRVVPDLAVARLLARLLIALLMFAGSARAWNDTGHLIVALKVWDALTAQEQARLATLLAAHPRFPADFSQGRARGLQGVAERARWDFAWAAAWPDYARGFDRERSLATREALVARYHFSRWHYVNLPTLLSRDEVWQRALQPSLRFEPKRAQTNRQAMTLNLVQALIWQRAQLNRAPPADAAVALCWVLHLVGDLHQPLHSTSLYARGRLEEGDRGGNELRLDAAGESWPPAAKLHASNLHALWDAALGTTRARRQLDAIVRALPTPDVTVANVAFADWAQESRTIADHEVYTPAIRAAVAASLRTASGSIVVPVDDAYRVRMVRIAKNRAAVAAARLLVVLKSAAVDR
jgi:hypothetical protein